MKFPSSNIYRFLSSLKCVVQQEMELKPEVIRNRSGTRRIIQAGNNCPLRVLNLPLSVTHRALLGWRVEALEEGKDDQWQDKKIHDECRYRPQE
jgi:hypothetical protein